MQEKNFIIAIGASAGGLPALCELFDHTLPDGISYVITTHLDPYYKSRLTEIIQRHSKIEVCVVEHNMNIRLNTVYVMPENKVMGMENGKLVLKARDLSIKRNMAIDIFFKSLADDTKFSKIAIVLSGMGEDGTDGVKALAKKGAYIIAQTPHSAEASSMPISIIASECADKILNPKDMPAAIINIVMSKRLV
jgi:two-component system CheB/CheR fusion protein